MQRRGNCLPDKHCGNCPEEYDNVVEESDYCYKFSYVSATFDLAKETCRGSKGILAELTTKEEMEKVGRWAIKLEGHGAQLLLGLRSTFTGISANTHSM